MLFCPPPQYEILESLLVSTPLPYAHKIYSLDIALGLSAYLILLSRFRDILYNGVLGTGVKEGRRLTRSQEKRVSIF